MTAGSDFLDRHIAFMRSATASREDAAAVRAVMSREKDTLLRDFYKELGKIDDLQPHLNVSDIVDRLKAAQSAHWDMVFADTLPPALAERSFRIGKAHADIGLSAGWYMAAYAWMLTRMIGPILRAHRLRPSRAAAVLETLVQRVFADMIASTAAYESRTASTQAAAQTHEADLQNLRRLSGIVSDVNDIALELAYLSRNTRDVNASAQTIASAVAELAASVEEIARSSDAAATDAGDTDDTVAGGRSVVNRAQDAMRAIAEAVDETAGGVDELARASDQIGQILSVIENIAGQTNLLALNATIEAARAGEAGRGFAVVAGEVKGLAGQTARATEDIARRIQSLRGGMGAILSTMERSRATVVDGRAAIEEAARTMDGIAERIGGVTHKMRDISGILSQQKDASAEVGRSVSRVAETAAENAALLDTIADKMQESNDRLSGHARSWFKADSARALCEMAKIDHILFRKRVVDVLMGQGEWKAAEVPDHHGCRLGKWYDAVDLPEIREHAAYRDLVGPHERVHASARRALAAHEAGDRAGAFAALAELRDASLEVLSGLERLSTVLFDEEVNRDRRRDKRRRAVGSSATGVAPSHAGHACCAA